MWSILAKNRPKFSDLQAKWYLRLFKGGFEDIEDTTREDRPLKDWRKVEMVLMPTFQPPGKKIISSFPESNYKEEQDFTRHPDFQTLCIFLCKHGNSRLTVKKVRGIWIDRCEGKTIRQSEKRYKLSDTTVFRVIKNITKWMKLMDTRVDNPGNNPEATIIVTRELNPKTDLPIIYSTWRNALWFDQKERDESRAKEFYSLATAQIKKLLSLPDTHVRIACAKNEPDFIAGYSVMTGNHLEFCYTKIDYRKKGIAKLLTKGFTSVATPGTKIGRAIAEMKNLVIKEKE